MRILYVITRSIAGGAQVHALDLMRAFGQTIQIGVAVGDEGFMAEEARRCGADVFVVPDLVRSVLPHRDLRAVGQLFNVMQKWRPDLVHAHTFKAGVIGRIAARLSGVPSVYTVHGWQCAPGTPLVQKPVAFAGEWLGARLGNAIITVSEFDREWAHRVGIVSRERLSVVHNGVTDCPLRAHPGATGPVNVVMTGRFVGQKDQLSLLGAMARVSGDWRLWFLGDGPKLDRVRCEARELGIAGRVRFFGHQPCVEPWLARAHVFALASHYEGLPLSILEALRSGLPVVAADVGGVRECVRDGVTGYLTRRREVAALGDALAALVASPSKRASMGAAGRSLFEAEFTASAMIAKIAAIYQRLTTQTFEPARSTDACSRSCSFRSLVPMPQA